MASLPPSRTDCTACRVECDECRDERLARQVTGLREALEEIKWTADAVVAGDRADNYCRGVAVQISNSARRALAHTSNQEESHG